MLPLTYSSSVLILAITLASHAAFAASPVDRSKPLALVRADFQLVDGSASNGAGGLFVPDVKAKQLWFFRPANKEAWQVTSRDIGGFSGTFFQLGALYIADNTSARILKSVDGKQLDVLAAFADGAKPNDLVVSRQGDVYVTMTKPGEIRRLTPEGQVSVAATGLETPNGITLAPDGKTLYVSLYKPGTILQAAVADDGTLGPMRPFATLEAADNGALADGMAIDRAGNVYCAGAEAIWIWNADGQLLDKLVTPQRPINCTFGGNDGTTLYISTFGGLYAQPMQSYGVEANIPMDGSLIGNKRTPTLPASIEAHWDVVYHQVGPRKLLADLFLPRQPKQKLPAIVLVHGGGWLHGDKTRFRPLAVKLAEAGYMVAAIEYRLGYEAKFPAGIQDCYAAVHFLRSHAADFGIDPERIGAVGGSAGGHLVGLMATAAEIVALQPARDLGTSSRLKAAVVMAGPMQIASGSVADRSQAGMTSNATHWLGGSIQDLPELYHLADAYEKISADDPPLLFITGSLDNPERDQPSLERCKQLGVEARQVVHDQAKHGHWNQDAWIEQVTRDIVAFLRTHL
jgi:gluconolactonase